jgi:hypothetical protein
MATYFKNVHYVPYYFGDDNTVTMHQNISAYVDLIDQIKNQKGFYEQYTILDGDRPDVLSQRLYGSPVYYWTFFLLNDRLREQGWPLTNQELEEFVQEELTDIVLTTEDDITELATRGTHVTGFPSGHTGTVVDRRLHMGQIIVRGDTTSDLFEIDDVEDTYIYETDTPSNTVTLTKAQIQYSAIRHYVDSDNSVVSFDPYSGPPETAAAVTWHEHWQDVNQDMREILILKPNAVGQIFGEFQDGMRKHNV